MRGEPSGSYPGMRRMEMGDDCGSDFGRIVAIWKASVRPSRGWSWVVGKPSLTGLGKVRP